MADKKPKSASAGKRRAASGGGRRLALVGAAGVLLVVWGFVLGILVGRGSLPTVIEPGRDEAAVKKPLIVAGPEKTKPDKGEPDLRFYQELAQKKPKTPPASTPPVEPRPKPAVKPKPKPKPEAKAKPESRLKLKPKKLKTQPKSSPKASPLPRPAKVEGRWSIQVAAFKNPAEARAYAKKVAASTRLKAKVVKVTLKGKGTWHRVRLGSFATRAAAKAKAATLKKGGLSVMIVSD